MKNTIKSYIGLSLEEKKYLWDNATFVFDTNVYLNLYRYSKKTRDVLLSAMNKMSDRIWMPHHVAMEYAEKREKEIISSGKRYSGLKDKVLKDIQDALRMKETDTEYIVIQDIIQKWISDYEGRNPIIFSPADDYILEELLILYDGKVGQPYDENTLNNLKDDGQKRYNNKIPPGYKDANKANGNDDKNSYGDFIIWKQIMDFSKESKKDIIYVTHDKKEDWWRIVNGETIGPRVELLDEFSEQTQMKFYMYNMEQFIYIFSENDDYQIDKSVIDEVKDFSVDHVVENGDESTIMNNRDLYMRIRNMQPGEIMEYIKKLSNMCDMIEKRMKRRQMDLAGIYNKYGQMDLPPKVAKVVKNLNKNNMNDELRLSYLQNQRNIIAHSRIDLPLNNI